MSEGEAGLPHQCLHCLSAGRRLKPDGMACYACVQEGHQGDYRHCKRCFDPLIIAREDLSEALAGRDTVQLDARGRLWIERRPVLFVEDAYRIGKLSEGLAWFCRRHRRRWIDRGVPEAECTDLAIIGSAIAEGRLRQLRLYDYVPKSTDTVLSIDPATDRPAIFARRKDGRWTIRDLAAKEGR